MLNVWKVKTYSFISYNSMLAQRKRSIPNSTDHHRSPGVEESLTQLGCGRSRGMAKESFQKEVMDDP